MCSLTPGIFRAAMRTLATAVVIPFTFVIVATPAAAQQWQVTPSVSAGLTHDDNFSLSPDNISIESVSGWAIEADAEVSYKSQLSRFTLTPRFNLFRYEGNSELDNDSAYLDFDYSYSGQLSNFRFRGGYADEAIRTAERSNIDFDADDPADIPTDDSGRVFSVDNRQRLLLRPNWSYQWGQKSTIRLGARYLDATYDESILGALRDFTETRGQATFEFDSSPRNTFALSAYYRQNEFQGTAEDLTGYGLSVGFNRSLSETTQLRLSAGFDETEDNTGANKTNPIGEVSIIRNLQTYALLASYQRSVQGSGSAQLSVRDSISLNLTRDLSEKFSVGAGLRAYQTQALDSGAVNFDERDYVQVGGLFVWNLSRTFSIDFDYRHTYIDRSSLTSDASSNMVTAWFRYRPIR